jgi:hypothetical protein
VSQCRVVATNVVKSEKLQNNSNYSLETSQRQQPYSEGKSETKTALLDAQLPSDDGVGFL